MENSSIQQQQSGVAQPAKVEAVQPLAKEPKGDKKKVADVVVDPHSDQKDDRRKEMEKVEKVVDSSTMMDDDVEVAAPIKDIEKTGGTRDQWLVNYDTIFGAVDEKKDEARKKGSKEEEGVEEEEEEEEGASAGVRGRQLVEGVEVGGEDAVEQSRKEAKEDGGEDEEVVEVGGSEGADENPREMEVKDDGRVEKEEVADEEALLVNGLINDYPDGTMLWWRNFSHESVHDLHKVLGGESDLSRATIVRVKEEMGMASDMGGRVAVHVRGLVAGDSIAFTVSYGPEELPITSSILVDQRRLFVTLRTIRLDRTTGEEWSAGEEDEFLDDDNRLALHLLNQSKALPQIKVPTLPIHVVRDASRVPVQGQSAASILAAEEKRVKEKGAFVYPAIDSYGPPGDDPELDEEEEKVLKDLVPEEMDEVEVDLEISLPFATPPSRFASTLYETGMEEPSNRTAKDLNDDVPPTPILHPLEDSEKSIVRPRRSYARRPDVPEKIVEPTLPRRESRGADYHEDDDNNSIGGWSEEAEEDKCLRPRCAKRHKDLIEQAAFANDLQSERVDHVNRTIQAEKELEKMKKEKMELMEKVKQADLRAERALDAMLFDKAEPVELDLDYGVQDEFIFPAASPPHLPVHSPLATPARARASLEAIDEDEEIGTNGPLEDVKDIPKSSLSPILVGSPIVSPAPTPLSVRARVIAAAPARSARSSRLARRVEKNKKRLSGIKRLEPSVWNSKACGPAMLTKWRSMTSTIGARRSKIEKGATLATALLTPKLIKTKEHQDGIKKHCDSSKVVVKGFNKLVTLAKQYADQVASAYLAMGGGSRKVCQSTDAMEKIATEFKKEAKRNMEELREWERLTAALPRC